MNPFEMKMKRRIEEIGQYRFVRKTVLSEVGFRESLNKDRLAEEPVKMIMSGEAWGGRDRYAEFSFALPPIEGGEVVLWFDLGKGHHLYGPEALVFWNGEPVQALDHYHQTVFLPAEGRLEPGGVRVLAWSGLEERRWIYTPPWLSVIHRECWNLYHDARCSFEVATLLSENDLRRQDIFKALNSSLHRVDFRHPGSEEFFQSIREAGVELRGALWTINPGEPSSIHVTAAGHCHIDLAWLWQLKHTREKTARSFSTACLLLDRYPKMVYTQGQAQLYEFVQADHPSLFERVRHQIAGKRWETGSVWVEPDCNLPNGESLIRQFLLGKNFFQDLSGEDNRVAWLPDTFGFNGNLPQILKGCGFQCFVTTKLSWNQVNRFPHDTFWWEGIDGSRILTHFVTTPPNEPELQYSTYNGILEPEKVLGLWERYREKEHNQHLLFTYGYGDGGGGPTVEMLENADRINRFPFLPRIQEGGLEDFGRKLALGAGQADDLPVWQGELYLEFHRGTYTTQGWLKKANRDLESLYRQAESFSLITWVMMGDYPQTELTKGWKTILLHQFHDILAGSSIQEVYDDARLALEAVSEAGQAIRQQALRCLVRQVQANRGDLIVFNPLGHIRSDPVEIEDQGTLNSDQTMYQGTRPLDRQSIEGGKILISGHQIPGFGYSTLTVGPGTEGSESPVTPLQVSTRSMENQFFRLEFDADGLIVSLWHRMSNRELIQAGARANCFQAFEDMPPDHDAWNIDPFYQDKRWDITGLNTLVLLEEGPLRGTLMMERSFGSSRITQYVRIYRDIDRIDFETCIDWHENNLMLKVAFPFDLRSSQAAYEIQCGFLLRPTHQNTSWDKARFEACAQRWIDLSEEDCGVALLNNGKYGHDLTGGVMRLTCLRSPSYPDPGADRGHHRFAYAVLPHRGSRSETAITERAGEFNEPLIALMKEEGSGSLLPELSWIRIDQSSVVLSAVKMSETGEGALVRLYESRGKRVSSRLAFWRNPRQAWLCNLIEQKQQQLAVQDGSMVLHFHPFEIKTILLVFDR